MQQDTLITIGVLRQI